MILFFSDGVNRVVTRDARTDLRQTNFRQVL